MVRRSAALEDLRSGITRSAGSFLRNVRWISRTTCSQCAGVPSPGYDRCAPCSRRGPGTADLLGFVTYAWSGGQAGRTMRAYKMGGATSHDLVASLVGYGVVAHWDCIAERLGVRPDGWTYVPSLSGRAGKHPLGEIAARFMGPVPQVTVSGADAVTDPRSFDPGNFVVAPTTATHVLIVEDTWTTGGHLQSVAAALKQAGVRRVTGLSIARWLDPSWANTQQLIDALRDPFEPDICPYTGRRC